MYKNLTRSQMNEIIGSMMSGIYSEEGRSEEEIKFAEGIKPDVERALKNGHTLELPSEWAAE